MFRPISRTRASLVVLLGLAALASGVLGARAAEPSYVPDEVVIRWAPGASAAAIEAVRSDLGATRLSAFDQIGASCERISRFSVAQAITRYAGDPRVRYIEPNWIVHIDTTPNDPLFPQLWGLRNTGQAGGTPGADIHATDAWSLFTGSSSVLVAIIDTGMDYTHPDLAANVWTNPGEIPGNGIDDDGNGFIDDVHGWDFANNDRDPMDDNGHGTHVSGTIGAVGNNALGVVGVNWTVRLMPIKFLGADGSGSTAAAISSVEFATKMGVRVMSNSWGGGAYSQALKDAIQAAGDAGILFVAAAGNSSDDNDLFPHYPSSYDLPNILAVAASDPADNLASFSCYGATSVDLAAPGTNILSTVPGASYASYSGTSMATPHVSGAAALLMGRFPGLDATSAKALLLADVDPVPALAGRMVSGGRLNAFLPLTVPDSVPPAPIVDLAVTRVDGSWAEIQWTATGDDGASGRAHRYDVRWASAPITEANFAAATRVAGLPDPAPAGATEHLRIDGLPAFSTTYWFAVKAFDELGNSSGMSNVASGTTLGPPVIAVAPSSLSADLLTGQQATRTLTISNGGASELRFQVQTEQVSAPAFVAPRAVPGALVPSGALAAAPAGYAAGATPARAPLVPAEVPPPGGSGGPGLHILMLESGSDVSEIRGLLAAFSDVAQVDVLDLATLTPTLDLLRTYDVALLVANTAVPNATGLGDVLADYVDGGGGLVYTLASFILGYEVTGRLLTGGYCPFLYGTGPVGSSLLGPFDASHPIMQGVTSASGSLLGSVALSPGAELVASWANGLPFVATKGRRVAALNAFFGGAGYWTGDVPLIVHNAASWASGAGYLTCDPAAGTVPAGGAVDVAVRYDATGLFGGDYDARIAIASNDPVTAQVFVPSRLHVTGAPDLALSAAAFDFGGLFVGASRPETLAVSNRGSDLLTVSSLSIAPDAFSTEMAGFTLAPRELRRLIVTFAPGTAAAFSGALEIHSDDPDTPVATVALTGTGLVPPMIAVAPDSLAADLLTAEKATRELTLTNSGGSPLLVELTVRPVPLGPAAAPAPAARPMMAPAAAAPTTAAPAMAAARARPAAATSAGDQNTLAPPPGPVALAGDYVGTYLHFGITDYGEIMPFQYPNGVEHLNLGTPIAGYTVAYVAGGVDHVAYCGYVQRYGFAPFSWREIRNDASTLVAEAVTRTSDNLVQVTRTFTFDKRDKGIAIRSTLSSPTGAVLSDVVFKEWADWDMDGDFYNTWDYDRARNMVVASKVHSAGIAAVDAPTVMDLDAWSDYYTRGTVVDFPSGPAISYDGFGILHFDLGTIAAGQSREVVTGYGAGDDLADLRAVIDRAVLFPTWLSAAPRTLEVPPNSSRPVTVTFDATGLLGGVYQATLVVRSNDPLRPEVSVPARLRVTGAPRIALSTDHLAFGTVYVGGAHTDTVEVRNAGTDLLTISSVDVGPAAFLAPTAGFTLAPGARRSIAVSFAPVVVGVVSGALTFHCDDPTQGTAVVALSGEGAEPPRVALTPEGLQVMMESGAVHSETLKIRNIGGSALHWSIAGDSTPVVRPALATTERIVSSLDGGAPETLVVQRVPDRVPAPMAVPTPPPLADVLTRLNSRFTGVTALIPNRFDFSEGETGTSILDGGEDMYDGGNLIKTNLGGPVAYSNNAIISSVAFGGTYFTRKYPGLFVLAANLSAVTTFTIYGDLGADGAGRADDTVLGVELGGSSFLGYVKRVSGAGTASVNHLIILADAGGTSRSYPLDTNNDLDQVKAASMARIYYLLVAGEGGAYIDNAAMLAIMQAFLKAVMPAPQWLTVTPWTGVLPAGGSSDLDVRFDTRSLAPGDYAAQLSVLSDDPLRPTVAVPVQLSVTVVTAAEASLVSAAVEGGVVKLLWSASADASAALVVQRRAPDGDWTTVASLRPDGTGRVRYEDRDAAPGTRYGYRLGIPDGGAIHFAGETWIEVPAQVSLALHGMTPNPAVRELQVAFSLPDARPAMLELLDLAGRRLRSRDVGALGAGRHVVSLGGTGALPAGVYLMRLQTAERSLIVKGVILE